MARVHGLKGLGLGYESKAWRNDRRRTGLDPFVLMLNVFDSLGLKNILCCGSGKVGYGMF